MSSSPGTGLPRSLEVILSSAVLVCLLPVLCLIAVTVAIGSPGGVVYRHRRIGRGGRPFMMLKFRTMRSDLAGPAVTRRGDVRVTSVGRFLRKTKLDEVLELWNVIRGDMSLVGPRPEAAQYVDLSNPLWIKVLSVRPGITDPMTLQLRNEEELLAAAGLDYETFYTRHLLPYKLDGYRDYIVARTWRRDLTVLWLTVLAVAVPSRIPPIAPEQIVSSIQTT